MSRLLPSNKRKSTEATTIGPPSTKARHGRPVLLGGGAMLVLLAAQVFLNLWGARTDGQTYDESVHLFVGYSFLRHGNYYDIDSTHPPFARSFAALPLLL